VVLAQHGEKFAERFRQFGLRLVRELESRQTRVVLITSALQKEGKTTVACNLSLALASMAAGRRIALVELDLRRPSICERLGLAPPPVGFERVLAGEVPLDAACQRSDSGVDLFLIGKPAEKAHQMLARTELGSVLTELNERYDTTVLDTPPVLAVPDVSLILPHVEACVTVVRNRSTPLSAIRGMLDVLPEEKVVGAFLNDARERHFGHYDYYSNDRED
jgi:Mrp family chromosome partitioning ATPase